MMKTSFPSTCRKAIALCGLLALATPAMADDSKSEQNSALKISGYVSIIGGSVVSGELQNDYYGPESIRSENCPCYTADWGHGSVYGSGFSLRKESKAGIQLTYDFSDATRGSLQAVARADGEIELAGLHVRHAINDGLSIKIGRDRIPLYAFSAFQDLGNVYPWISPPPELYGWDATYFNGASLEYTWSAAGASWTANAFAGRESIGKSGYNALFYEGDTRVKWKNIAGLEIQATRGPWSARAIHMRANTRTINTDQDLNDGGPFTATGASLGYDAGKWFATAEAMRTTRGFSSPDLVDTGGMAYSVGAGLHMGPWTPFVSVSGFQESTGNPDLYDIQANRRLSGTLRYNLDANTSIKAQIDRNIDATRNFGGNSTVFRISFDKMFF